MYLVTGLIAGFAIAQFWSIPGTRLQNQPVRRELHQWYRREEVRPNILIRNDNLCICAFSPCHCPCGCGARPQREHWPLVRRDAHELGQRGELPETQLPVLFADGAEPSVGRNLDGGGLNRSGTEARR
jgi:hypothetical protein